VESTARSGHGGKPMSDTLHVDDAGLWLPEEYGNHDQGVVIRTPRATIDHKPGGAIGPQHGMIRPRDFGDEEEFHESRNPELAPDRVKLKRYGEDPETFRVEVDR